MRRVFVVCRGRNLRRGRRLSVLVVGVEGVLAEIESGVGKDEISMSWRDEWISIPMDAGGCYAEHCESWNSRAKV